MNSFSSKSLLALETCDPRLQKLFHRVLIGFDCTVLEGKRSEAQQVENVKKGVSKTMDSKHVFPLGQPSRAADVAPYPLKWPDRKSPTYVKDVAAFYAFGGYVMGIADGLGIKIRWGGDWDGDEVYVDQVFDDLVHFELAE